MRLRNRKLLTDKAREVFAEQGLDAPLDEIARRAAVGNATSNATSRPAPCSATKSSEMRIRRPRRRASGHGPSRTPGQDCRQYLRTVFAGLATDRGTNGLMATNLEGVTSLEAIHAHNRETIDELLRRGQEQGTIRPDLTVQDLLFTPAALGRSVPALTGVAPDARLRPLTLLPDGLRASPAAPLLLTPPPGPAVCPPPSGGPSAHEQEARSPPYGPEPDAVAARRPGA